MSKKSFFDPHNILGIILHVIFVSVVIYFIWPILTLYFNQKPAVGIDLFLSVDFVTYVRDNFNWPFSSWKYIWYGGTPLAQTYPLLHFYLIQPLLNWFSAPQAVQIYALFSIVLFCVFSYLFYYSTSKSRGLSALLAIATAYSFNLWSSLYWSGSIPYAATMFFLPLSLYLVMKSYESKNKKYIYFAGLLSGLFILAHPQSFIGYTVPLATLLILTYSSTSSKLFSWQKLGVLFIYAQIIFFVGFPQAGIGVGILSSFANILGSALTSGAQEISQSYIAEYAQQTGGTPFLRTFDVFRRTNPLFFIAAGIGLMAALVSSVIALIIKKGFSHYVRLLLPAILMIIYLFWFLYAFVLGINPISGGWFRVFWPTMIIFGFLVSVLWRIIFDNFEITFASLTNKFTFLKKSKSIVGGFIGIGVLILGIPFLQKTYPAFIDETLSYVELSSAFPTSISTNIHKDDWPDKLEILTPDWLDGDDLRYRLYDMDATVNIWWNSLNKMPLARGYLDAAPSGPSGVNYGGWQYLQNVTLINDESVDRWNTSEELAIAQSKFFLDWHAIKYLEGEPSVIRPYSNRPSSFLIENPEIIARKETKSVYAPSVLWDAEGDRFLGAQDQDLTYYEVNDELVSPIYSGSDSPTVLIIGDADAQNLMIRNFSFLNLNSQRAILVQWNAPIDEISQEELNKFDLVWVYRYEYKSRNKSFKRLENYVKNGGNLFIDTGGEQVESNSINLPSVFPFDNSERKAEFKDWDWEIKSDHEIVKDVDFTKFDAPIFDDEPWSLAYPVGGLKQNATKIASSHDRAILAVYDLGEGKIVWSGFNIAGHVQRYKNPEEIQLFQNILDYLGDFSKKRYINVDFARPSSEKVVISGAGGKGVLFKEAGYPGWDLTIKSDGKKYGAEIYQAGPMVPGYMYAFLPEEIGDRPYEAEFKYKGEGIYKLTFLISALAFLVTVDYIFIGGRSHRIFRKSRETIAKTASSFWEKE